MIKYFRLLLLLFVSVTQFDSAKAEDVRKDLSVFSDNMATSLKKGVKQQDIDRITNPKIKKAALEMLANNYDTKYRLATYKAVLSADALGKQLSISSGYSKFENLTGIYLPKGKSIVLIAGIAKDKKINLVVPNWYRLPPEGVKPSKDPNGWGVKKTTISLKNGVNEIELSDFDGLAYIDYYSLFPEKEQPIQAHFIGASVNGYFDAKTQTDADWNKMLDQAVYPIIEAIGKHVHVVYPVADCKKYAYNKGVALMNNYDELIAKQYEIMGWMKYNHVPKNRILSRVNYNYYMFKDGDGVAYMGGKEGYALDRLLDPDKLIYSGACWGFSHEIGHVHQLAPYFNWGGMAEVSNNICSMYVTKFFGLPSNLGGGKKNYYELARTHIIDKKISYLLDSDNYNRLVPFWQLQLYFTGEGRNSDFYPDLYEAFRKQASNKGNQNLVDSNTSFYQNNPAAFQLNFVKTACQIGKTDLTDFFELYGFFYIGNFPVKSYSTTQYSMTQEMVDECKASIKAMNFPKPRVDLSTLQDK